MRVAGQPSDGRERPGRAARRRARRRRRPAARRRPIQSRICVVPSPLPKRPQRSAANPSRGQPPAIRASGSARTRPGGSVAPSRTAAIGGTRVARSAGRRLAISVTRIPTSSETTIVRVSKRRPLFGSVKPTASKSLKRPFASAEPEEEPDRPRRATPIDERFEDDRPEHLPARGAERPERRELARPLRDRDRERVRDHEAADEERDRRRRRAGSRWRKEMNSFVSAASSAACSLAGSHLRALGAGSARTLADELLRRVTPGSPRPARSGRACRPCRRAAAPSGGRSRRASRRRSSRPSRT